MQNYALKVKVINSVSAESAEFLNCRAGELITLIAKDCHRYTVIICFSAFSLLLVADRPTNLAFRLLVCGLKPGLDFSEDSISSKKWLLMHGIVFLVHGSTSSALQTHAGCLENTGNSL